MSTFLTYAPSCSPGTRTSSVANAPAGTVFGCRLTCPCAPAGATSAAAPAAAAAICLILILFLPPRCRSSDRDLDRAVALFELRDAVPDFDLPRPGRAEDGRVEDVVAGARERRAQRQRPDVLRGQAGDRGQFPGSRVLGAGARVDQVEVDRVRADARRVDGHLEQGRADPRV